jgi:hypothetical protein
VKVIGEARAYSITIPDGPGQKFGFDITITGLATADEVVDLRAAYEKGSALEVQTIQKELPLADRTS